MIESENKRIRSELQTIATVAITFVTLFAGSWILFRAFPPFAHGIQSANPNDYPAAKDEIQGYFSLDARHLPVTIPNSATSIDFMCSTAAGGQASPWLKLRFKLPPEDAQHEIARLQSLNPTGILKQGLFFNDPLDQLQPSDKLIVLGFLSPFKPDYRNGPAAPPDRLAYVTYDQSTGEFYYEFNSD